MKPYPDHLRLRVEIPTLSLLGLVIALASPVTSLAQGQRKNPASKVYITDVSGEALIDTGEAIEDLTKRAVFTVQGAVIETKRPESPSDQNKYFSTMVYSNGTGAYFDADTRVEVKRFVQEPFTPNRNDAEVEPSISRTQAFLSRGSVGLCNSKLVAGSSMTYDTPNASIKIRGRKLVMEATDNMTKVSMLEGESTIQAGPTDTGGHVVKAGEQAIIRRDVLGQTTRVEIRPIPPQEMPALDDKVAMACMARKSVYFEVKEKSETLAADESANETGGAAAGASGEGDTAFSPVTAFDGGSSSASSGVVREIVAVEILPPTLPVEYTVSTASITTVPPR
jgi:hypothetical protein